MSSICLFAACCDLGNSIGNFPPGFSFPNKISAMRWSWVPKSTKRASLNLSNSVKTAPLSKFTIDIIFFVLESLF